MKPYRHRLNREDAATGTILIEKRAWLMFPEPMREFAIEVSGKRFATRIVAEDCICRPPAHQHWHLEATHLRERLNFSAGDTIEIEQTDAGYVMRNG